MNVWVSMELTTAMVLRASSQVSVLPVSVRRVDVIFLSVEFKEEGAM